MDNKFLRVIDANINRAKEGIRVVEDLIRYYFDNIEFSKRLKDIRHQIEAIFQNNFEDCDTLRLINRDSIGDVGLNIKLKSEEKREDINSIFLSNIRRASEALRSLEEFTKLYSIEASTQYKIIRYKIYQLEKEIFIKVINGKKKKKN